MASIHDYLLKQSCEGDIFLNMNIDASATLFLEILCFRQASSILVWWLVYHFNHWMIEVIDCGKFESVLIVVVGKWSLWSFAERYAIGYCSIAVTFWCSDRTSWKHGSDETSITKILQHRAVSISAYMFTCCNHILRPSYLFDCFKCSNCFGYKLMTWAINPLKPTQNSFGSQTSIGNHSRSVEMLNSY